MQAQDFQITKFNVVSALLAGLISGGTAMVAMLTGVDSFSEIPGPAYAVVAIGMLITFAKDLQTWNRPHPPSELPPGE